MFTIKTLDGTTCAFDAEKAIALISASNKPCVFTEGLSYRNPAIHRIPISNEKVFTQMKTNPWTDVTEEPTCWHINQYDVLDME